MSGNGYRYIRIFGTQCTVVFCLLLRIRHIGGALEAQPNTTRTSGSAGAPCTHPPPYPASCTQALLQGHCTQLTLAYCAPNPYSFEGMQGVLEQIAETLPGLNVKTEVS